MNAAEMRHRRPGGTWASLNRRWLRGQRVRLGVLGYFVQMASNEVCGFQPQPARAELDQPGHQTGGSGVRPQPGAPRNRCAHHALNCRSAGLCPRPPLAFSTRDSAACGSAICCVISGSKSRA